MPISNDHRCAMSTGVLSPTHKTIFLCVIEDSTTMQAQSPAQVDPCCYDWHQSGPRFISHFSEAQGMLGLTAAAANIILSGLLHMRPFQVWKIFTWTTCPGSMRDTHWRLCTLNLWKRPRFLNMGPTLGVCCCLTSLWHFGETLIFHST